MENEQLMIFNNEEVKIKTDEGITLINLANTSRILGITKIANSGNEIIKWKNGNKGVYGKIEKIRASLGCAANVAEQKYVNEIDYILNEIEETDDRNSIYMSRYLTSMLAMECHNDKAMQYKSWLAQLDESYSNGKLSTNQEKQLENLSNQINLVANTMTQIGKAFVGIQEYVKSSIQAKDGQIDEIKDLIGFRNINTRKMSNEIKDKLYDKLGKRVYATSPLYQEIKQDIFKKFKVVKWEDVPVYQYNDVYSYLDEIVDIKYGKAGIQ